MKKEQRPLFFVFELTQLCSSNCSFCYNVWKSPDQKYPSEPPLSNNTRKTLLKKLITELNSCGRPLLGFALAGGEPLLSPDCLETASYLLNRGIPVNLASNGILLTRETIIQLREMGLQQFEVSLPAADEQCYSSLTNSPQLTVVRENLLSLKELHPRAHLTIAITITKENLNSVSGAMDLAIAFSADAIVLNRFIPGGRGEKHRDILTPSLKELNKVLTVANEKSALFEIPTTVTIPIEDCHLPHAHFPHLRFGTCTCGESKWVIDPAGNLRLCEQHPKPLGNLLTESFATLSTQTEATHFRLHDRYTHCSECSKQSNCGGGCRFL